MFSRVAHLVVAVRDLGAAERQYASLLGRGPAMHGFYRALGAHSVVFALANCDVELLASTTPTPAHPLAIALAESIARVPESLFALALGCDVLADTTRELHAEGLVVSDPVDVELVAGDGTRRDARVVALGREHTRGVNVLALARGRAAAAPEGSCGSAPASASGVDHVVIVTDDLARTVALWRDAFAIPERWRRELPERGTVNVGLHIAGVTVEVVAPAAAVAGDHEDRLWGIAYAVADCASAVARLRAEGVPVGDPRPGLAPATRVASVKRVDGVPTLLIEHAGR